MRKIGWVWLLTLDECSIPVVLCKEFISTFTFNDTTNLSTTSIHFNLFGEQFEMSIKEWTSSLGIYTREEMATGEVRKWERGVPGKQIAWDRNETWKKLTGKKEGHTYQNAQAYHLLDPILRICHIIMVSNINGMSTFFSKMPASSLYSLDRIERGMKVHLGYWLARILMLICKTPNRNYTLCYILGVFVMRNFVLGPDALEFDKLPPRPYTLDITCLLRAGVIREEGGKYHFYEPGETPKEMMNLSGAEAKSARKLKLRLAKLDEIEQKTEGH